MDPSAQDAWFFSRDGQQSGPLRFEEIQAKAREGLLQPRTDLLWREGMPDWRPIGEIEGLFDRRPIHPQDEANPYASPREDSASVVAAYGEWPGFRRRTYLLAAVLMPFVAGLAYGLMISQPGVDPESAQTIAGNWIFNAVIVLIFFVATLKRLVNVGMSRWWILGTFVPIVNLWVGYRNFACPAGYAAHKKMDGAGVFLAIVYWLSVILMTAYVVVVFWMLFSTAGDADLQRRIQEMLEQRRGGS